MGWEGRVGIRRPVLAGMSEVDINTAVQRVHPQTLIPFLTFKNTRI